MRIAIFGSTSPLGRRVLLKALAQGHRVSTLVRDPGELGFERPYVRCHVGTIGDYEKVAACASGVDVAISADWLRAADDVAEAGITGFLRALGAAGVGRYVHVGSAAVRCGSREALGWRRRVLRARRKIALDQPLSALEIECAQIRAAPFPWVLVRPAGILHGRPGRGVAADEARIRRLFVGIDDLADFVIESGLSSRWCNKAPLVSSN